MKTNTSLQIYYYNCTDLSLTSVVPNEVLLDELPRYVTLEGSGFFDWEETVCYFGPHVTTHVVFVDSSHLQCKVGGRAAIEQLVFLGIQIYCGRHEEPAIILVTRAFGSHLLVTIHARMYTASFVWTSLRMNRINGMKKCNLMKCVWFCYHS